MTEKELRNLLVAMTQASFGLGCTMSSLWWGLKDAIPNAMLMAWAPVSYALVAALLWYGADRQARKRCKEAPRA